MSLINQMLRDLDTRHADNSTGDLPRQLRPLPKTAARMRLSGRGILGGVLLAVAALAFWLSDGLLFSRNQQNAVLSSSDNASPAAVAEQSPVADSVLADGVQAAAAVSSAEAPAPADELMISMPALTRALAPEAAPAAGSGFGLRLDQALSLPTSFAPVAKNTETSAGSKRAANRQSGKNAQPSTSHPVSANSLNAPSNTEAQDQQMAAKESLPQASSGVESTEPDVSASKVRIEKVKRAEEVDETLRTALARYRQGQVDEAVQTLRQVLQTHPDQARLRQALLGILVEQKRLDEALELLQRGLALQPEQTGWAMAAARILVERSRPEEAWAVLQQHQASAQQNAEYQGFAAVLLQHLKRPHEALGYFEAALRLKPQEARWWYALGLALDEDGQAAQAMDAYRRAQGLGTLPASLATALEKRLAR